MGMRASITLQIEHHLLILALDTSSRAGSAALLRDGTIVCEREGDPSRTHGERLPGELMDMLRGERVSIREIDLYAAATGPGSFTGLRVGIATIQGLALPNDKLVVPVSTFDALVAGARDARRRVAAWIDAHRGEVFAALYSPEGQLLQAPSSLPPQETLDRWCNALTDASEIVFTGDGAWRYADVIRERLGRLGILGPPAGSLAGTVGQIAYAERSRAVHPHAIVPTYVRRPDAELARDRAART
jgi:tRNA threonylcarbamoyladenosine biosynthesis protein TsaB